MTTEALVERAERLDQKAELPQRLILEGGLPPFREAREFTLREEEGAPPFLRVESTTMDLAYTVVDPFLVVDEYRPRFSDADCEAIGLARDQKPLVLAIVNLSRGVNQATINLVGPLLINPATGRGKQAVLENSSRYTTRQRLV